MVSRRVGLVLVIASILVLSTFYSTQANAFDAPTNSKFEITGNGNVNTHTGDMSLSIPLMNVPGRGGTGFPIVLSYGSGITLNQKASMVGLGWGLNTPHISRTVMSIPDDYNGDTIQGDNIWYHDKILNSISYMAREHRRSFIKSLMTLSSTQIQSAPNDDDKMVPNTAMTIAKAAFDVAGDYIEGYYLYTPAIHNFPSDPQSASVKGYLHLSLPSDPNSLELNALMDANSPDVFTMTMPSYTGELVYGSKGPPNYQKVQLHAKSAKGNLADDESDADCQILNPGTCTDSLYIDMIIDDTDEGNHLIGGFFVTDNGGTKYEFVPTIKAAESLGDYTVSNSPYQNFVSYSKTTVYPPELSHACDFGDNGNHLERQLLYPYYTSWGLKKIYDSNYVDDENGNWIQFNYIGDDTPDTSDDWTQTIKGQAPHNGGCITNPDGSKSYSESFTSQRLLESIETPLYKSHFEYSAEGRRDGLPAAGGGGDPDARLPLLERIWLENKHTGEILNEIIFTHDYTLAVLTPDNEFTENSGNDFGGRLTLTQVDSYGLGGKAAHDADADNKLPPTKFDYYGRNRQTELHTDCDISNPSHLVCDTNKWYKSENDLDGFVDIEHEYEWRWNGFYSGRIKDDHETTGTAPEFGVFQIIEVDPNTEYNVEAQTKRIDGCTSNCDYINLKMGFYRGDLGHPIQSQGTGVGWPDDQWHKISTYMTSPSDAQYALISIYTREEHSADFVFDELNFFKTSDPDTNLLTDYGFEYCKENCYRWIPNNFDRWNYYYLNGDYMLHNSEGNKEGLVSQLWSLDKIHWPTGGTTEWEYEIDRYVNVNNWFADRVNDIIQKEDTHYGGGLRVSEVKNCDGLDNCYSTKYLYVRDTDEDGPGIDALVDGEKDGINNYAQHGESSGFVPSEPGSYEYNDDRILHGNTYTKPYVGYSTVFEINTYNDEGTAVDEKAPYGWTKYEYTSTLDYPDTGNYVPPTIFTNGQAIGYPEGDRDYGLSFRRPKGIEEIGLSGKVTLLPTSEDDDIEFMIIAQKDTQLRFVLGWTMLPCGEEYCYKDVDMPSDVRCGLPEDGELTCKTVVMDNCILETNAHMNDHGRNPNAGNYIYPFVYDKEMYPDYNNNNCDNCPPLMYFTVYGIAMPCNGYVGYPLDFDTCGTEVPGDVCDLYENNNYISDCIDKEPYPGDGICDIEQLPGYVEFPKKDMEQMRGLLERVSVYNSEGGMIKEASNNYNKIGGQITSLDSIIVNHNFPISRWMEITETQTILDNIVTRTQYDYSSTARLNGLPYRIIEHTNDDTRITTNKYAFQMNPNMLLNKHMRTQHYSILIEDSDGIDLAYTETTWDDTFPTIGTDTMRFFPKQQSAGIIGENTLLTEYTDYNLFGQLIHEKTYTDPSTYYNTYYYYGSDTDECNNAVANNPLKNMYLTCVENVVGQTKANYNSLGQIASITDINNKMSRFVYDDLWRLIESYQPGDYFVEPGHVNNNPTTTYEYTYALDDGDDLNYDNTLTDMDMNQITSTSRLIPDTFIVTHSYFDGMGRERLSAAMDNEDEHIITETKYNEIGLVDETSNSYKLNEDTPYWTKTMYKNSPLTRVKKVYPLGEYPTGTFIETQYLDTCGTDCHHTKIIDERNDYIISKTDKLGRNVLVQSYDENDNLIKQTSTLYNDVLSQDITITNALGHDIRTISDSLGRVRIIQNPDFGVRRILKYDARGNILRSADGCTFSNEYGSEDPSTYGCNRAVDYTYDALNRLKTVDYGRNGIDTTYYYDDYTSAPSYCDELEWKMSKGKLTYVESTYNTNYKACFGYDYRGRLRDEIREINGVIFWGINRDYDNLNNIANFVYPFDKGKLRYFYDKLGRLESVYPASGFPGVDHELIDYEYNNDNTLSFKQYADGIKTYYTYTPRNWIEQIKTRYINTDVPGVYREIEENYLYDNTGNLKNLHEKQILTSVPDTPELEQWTAFSYDALNRLTQSTPTTDTGRYFQTLDYDYDAVGNMLSRNTETFPLYDGTNRVYQKAYAGSIGSTTYGYDNFGNRETASGWQEIDIGTADTGIGEQGDTTQDYWIYGIGADIGEIIKIAYYANDAPGDEPANGVTYIWEVEVQSYVGDKSPYWEEDSYWNNEYKTYVKLKSANIIGSGPSSSWYNQDHVEHYFHAFQDKTTTYCYDHRNMLTNWYDTVGDCMEFEYDDTGNRIVKVEMKEKKNNALKLDGDHDYVYLNKNLRGLDMPFTIEAWVKIPDENHHHSIFVSDTYSLKRIGIWMTITDGSQLRIFAADQQENYRSGWSTEDVNRGTWTHVAAVMNSNDDIKLYINGQQAGDTIYAGEEISSIYHVMDTGSRIGYDSRYSIPRFFKGKIDEVRVWNIGRTQPEIAEDMNKELEDNEPGLVAYWKFNEGDGAYIYDSVDDNDGVLHDAKRTYRYTDENEGYVTYYINQGNDVIMEKNYIYPDFTCLESCPIGALPSPPQPIEPPQKTNMPNIGKSLSNVGIAIGKFLMPFIG
ncbi:LamG-like jellyroll fold domain-containing protein [Candidatus Aenigmatarchaeota archaeon]